LDITLRIFSPKSPAFPFETKLCKAIGKGSTLPSVISTTKFCENEKDGNIEIKNKKKFKKSYHKIPILVTTKHSSWIKSES
jgi:hypothetical protein